jgi:peptidoglycan/LPS O-acetylase OafA/YrhL
VFAHFQFDLGRYAHARDALPDLSLGNAGVDLFFVISGFVIVYASEPLFGRPGAPLRFFTHRAIRIVPLYWLVTTLYIAMAFGIPHFGKDYSLATVVASYLFVPLRGVDGYVEPVVGQGWTLNYEMLFYVVFTFAVWAPRRIAVALAATVLLAAVIAGQIAAPASATLVFWSNPIVVEFLLGMAIALAYRDGVRLPQPVAVVIMIAGFTLLALGNYAVHVSDQRLIMFGLPAALVVAGATFGAFSLHATGWTLLAVVGDASYALYLFHSFAVRGVLMLAARTGLDVARHPWPYLAAAVIGAIAIAVAVHYTFERPVTRLLRRLTQPATGPERRIQPVT